ncbi:MAG: hypothetical protein FJ088_13325, partial [Deltaproteobacteria bacterium]|nr:hypothetical protein [Deltaproteobacteria bacterium]
GSMGGYVNFSYLYHVMSYFFFGGFCPMEQILNNLEHVNEAGNPDVFCGPNKPTMPYEWEWDYNHWHFDDSGGTWDRTFYGYVIEGLFMAFGNMLSYNPDNTYLPAGVPASWLEGISEDDKCREALVIGKPYNYNSEYNPEGKYSLITYCDGEEPVGCYQGNPELCGKSNPDYWKLMGAYDPAVEHPYQAHMALAVDYNGNGKRDYGEPLINNSAERFKDTGADGCNDEFEDGNGGCLSDGNPANEGKDPNGDDFDLNKNFTGTEGNFSYDKGEDFPDFGLDGVPESVSGFKDYGEGNGEFDYNPYIKEKQDWEALAFFRNADIEKIKRMNFYFDGGIRDAIHALTGAIYFTNTLKSRGIEVREYDDFTATENSLYPGIKDEQFLEKITEIDFSPESLGRNILMRYGDPDATPQEIKNGDGKHVGTAGQILNRLLFFFTFAMMRWPEPDYSPTETDGAIINSSFYSQ